VAGRKIIIEFLGKDSTGNTASVVEKKFGKVGGTLDRVGQRAGKVLAGGFVLAGAAAVKMGKAAMEDEASAAKLAQTLKTATGATKGQVSATESWITAQGKSLGVTDDELRPALSKLAVATGDVGEAQKLAALAMDVSAGTGKDLGAVSQALAKAQGGNVAGLARLGIATKDASGKALTLDQIQKNLAATHSGAAAKAADTTAGKQRIMALRFGELQEQIGAKLLPVMNRLVEIGLKVTEWISHNTTTVGIAIGAIVAIAATMWTVSVAMRAWTTATQIWTGVQKVATAAQWLFNAAMTANPIGLVVLAIVGLVAALVIAYKKSETFRAIVDGAFKAVKRAAEFAFNWIKDHWKLLLAIIAGPIGIAVGLVAKHWNSIKAGAKSAVDWIRGKFNGMVDFFRGIPGKFSRAFSGAFNGLRNAFRSAVNFIINGWNRLHFTIPSVNTHIPGVGRIGGFTMNTPNIPRLAKGGVVKARPGGILANIGEGKYDEGVFPLDRNGLPRGLAAAGIGGQAPIVVQLVVDGKTLAQSLVRFQRETGRPIFA
jgi:hypothetical protein